MLLLRIGCENAQKHRAKGLCQPKTHSQNLKRRFAWTLRIAFARSGKPNCVLVTVVFQFGKLT